MVLTAAHRRLACLMCGVWAAQQLQPTANTAGAKEPSVVRRPVLNVALLLLSFGADC
jgi:hypothetical protein